MRLEIRVRDRTCIMALCFGVGMIAGACDDKSTHSEDGGVPTDSIVFSDGAVDALEPVADAAPVDAGNSDCMAGAFCDTGNPCEVGEIACLDGQAQCMPMGVKPAGTVCREISSPCDAAELCDGSSNACPPDEGLTEGTACIGADPFPCEVYACYSGICGLVGETCNGSEVCTPEGCV